MTNTETLERPSTFEEIKGRTAEQLWTVAEDIGDKATVLAFTAVGSPLPKDVIREGNDVGFAVARAMVETGVDHVETVVDRVLDPLPDRMERPIERFLGVEQAEHDSGRTQEELWTIAEGVGDIATLFACLAARVKLPAGVIGTSNDVRFAVIRSMAETAPDRMRGWTDEKLEFLPDAVEGPVEDFLGIK